MNEKSSLVGACETRCYKSPPPPTTTWVANESTSLVVQCTSECTILLPPAGHHVTARNTGPGYLRLLLRRHALQTCQS